MRFLLDSNALDYIFNNPEVLENTSNHIFLIPYIVLGETLFGGPAVNFTYDGNPIWSVQKEKRMQELRDFILENLKTKKFHVLYGNTSLLYGEESHMDFAIGTPLGFNTSDRYRSMYKKSKRKHGNKRNDIAVVELLLDKPDLYLVSDDNLGSIFKENNIDLSRLIRNKNLQKFLRNT